MENRKQARVEVALEVELSHPVIGHRTLVARDLNAEGVYLFYPDPPFKLGSAINVTLLSTPMIESRPTPTVKMRVSRLDANGLVASFINKSGAHLWRHAAGELTQLRVGEDLFRVFLAAIVRDHAGRVLTVQQNGRWLFPGCYLQVGHDWNLHLRTFLERALNLTDCSYHSTVLTHNDPHVVARESSTMSVFQLYTLPASKAERDSQPVSLTSLPLPSASPYSRARWIENERQLEELSFSAEPLRELARSLLKPAQTDRQPPAKTAVFGRNTPASQNREELPQPGYQHG